MTTNNDLAEQIGNVRQELGRLMEGQKHASTGRAVLHEKLDKIIDAVQLQALAIAGASKDASLASSTAAQTRDRLDAFDREVRPVITELKGKVEELEATNKTEVGPVLTTVKQVRTIGVVLIGLASVSALSVGSVFAFFNGAAKSFVLNWLGLA